MKTEMTILKNIMVPMRDGINLATDIYLPAIEAVGTAGTGSFPVILERTPYDKTSPSRSERTVSEALPMGREKVASFFIENRYAVVYQDCRGRFASEGSFTKYLSEGEDGYDTIIWILNQSWCSGKIATMGLSYAAHAQAALACLDPPGLACMFLDSGGFSNAYQGAIRQGGAFEMKQATWAYKQALESPAAKNNPVIAEALKKEDIKEWFARMPWKKGHSPIKWVPEYEDYLFEQWQHGKFDDFWKQIGIYAEGYYDVFSDVPMIHMSSWFDPYARTATENYMGLKAKKKSEICLVLGPWTHGNRCLTFFGDVDFGPEAPIDGNLAKDFLNYRLAWFDRHLKKTAAGGGEKPWPAVSYFMMGGGSGLKNSDGRLSHGGKWKYAETWPLPGMQLIPYYLSESGTLDTSPSPLDKSSLSYDYDPENPVPSIGGTITSGEPVMTGGAFDQREEARFFGSKPPYLPLASRSDVLVFETAPLEKPLEVTGPVEAKLWISSSCPDTDFTIKLIDVYPPDTDYPQGFAMNITDGILRVRYRSSWENPEFMEEGKVYQILIKAFPTSNLFAKGHRIRLDISSSNYPHFDINPNTGEPEGAWLRMRTAVNTVHMNKEHPSHLLLPVVQAK